jgi:hypothetical protein
VVVAGEWLVGLVADAYAVRKTDEDDEAADAAHTDVDSTEESELVAPKLAPLCRR